MWACTPDLSMSLAWRAADAVSCGLGATGPHPLAARVALISLSTAPPSSPEACVGAAAAIAPNAIIAAAHIGMRAVTFP